VAVEKVGAPRASSLSGVYPVLQTPFNDDETIDYGSLTEEIAWVKKCGADGVVTGMVSEVLRLASDERDQLARVTCEAAQGSLGVILSVGAESTYVAVRHARHAEAVGADAVMAIPPLSVAADLNDLRRYYDDIVLAIDIPVVVQDASGYVGRSMPVEFQAKLVAEYGERVLLKPEALPIGPRLSQLRDATSGTARVFDGTGGIALIDSFHRGIVGTMPGADLTWVFVSMWTALKDGHLDRAERIGDPLVALISLQGSLGAFVAVEKYLLVRQGVIRGDTTRGPRGFILDRETRDEVDRLFGRLQEVVG
jgi:4-hydroxy-tetrahydrodipicolinate synthase